MGSKEDESEKAVDVSPNWEHWLSMPTVTVLEGVALSLNINPNLVSDPNDAREPFSRMMRGEVWDSHLKERIEVIRRAALLDRTNPNAIKLINTGNFEVDERTADRYLMLQEFVRFGVRSNWKLPERLLGRKAPENLQAPDWEEWRARPLVSIWEAAALSLDISPDRFRYREYFDEASQSEDGEMMLHDDDADWDVLEAFQQKFRRRTATLERAAKADELGKHFDQHGLLSNRHWNPFAFVQVKYVLAYLDTSDIQVPEGWRLIADLSRPPELSAPSDRRNRWPWGEYETKTLRALADAVKQWWTTYDSADPTTAPSNDDVSDYLEKQGVPATVAKQIASIIRADDAPAGRRRATS